MTLRQISTRLISVLRRQKQNGLVYIASTYIINKDQAGYGDSGSLGRWRKEGCCKFEASLGYKMSYKLRPYLRAKQNKKPWW